MAPDRNLPDWPIGGGSGSGSGRINLSLGVNAEEEEEAAAAEVGGDGSRHAYNQAETLALYDAWISVSYDPVVGNQQTNKCFWKKVTEVYNARRPKNTFARNVKMLRSHWDRCDKDVKKFCAIYRAEEANYQSGASGADILRAALRVFKDDVGKDFKLVDVWSQVHHLERWAGGVESGSKRTKRTARGHYSSSDGGEGNTSREGTPTDDAGGSSSGARRRPQGTKAAKAARARGRARARGMGRGGPSQAGSGSGSGTGTGSHTLMSMYLVATMADLSKMNPGQVAAHMAGIEYMRAQLGIVVPPTSGDDDSPAE